MISLLVHVLILAGATATGGMALGRAIARTIDRAQRNDVYRWLLLATGLAYTAIAFAQGSLLMAPLTVRTAWSAIAAVFGVVWLIALRRHGPPPNRSPEQSR